MVSATQQTQRIRARKARRAGIRRKRADRSGATPAFSVQPAGYDKNAADAPRIRTAAESAEPRKK